MSYRQSTIFILTLSVVTLLFASEAKACGACMTALIDRLLPPAEIWCVFTIVWFLAVSVVVTINGNVISIIPSISKSVILVLCLLISSIMIGSLGILLLLLPYPFITWNVLFNNYESIKNKQIYNALKIITIISLITFSFLVAYASYIQRYRSHSEFILRWEGTYAAKSLIHKLMSRGSENITDLRIIVDKGEFSNASLAAKGLSDFGDPETDIPILTRTLKKCNSDESCTKYMVNFEQAIQKLNERKN